MQLFLPFASIMKIKYTIAFFALIYSLVGFLFEILLYTVIIVALSRYLLVAKVLQQVKQLFPTY